MQQALPINEYKLKVIKAIDEAPEVKTFRLETKNNIDFFPGQFFMVRFDDNEVLKRAYSIASSPTNKEHMDITMNLVAEFTKKLWQVEVGDYLIFKGPYGKFYFNQDIKNKLVLIGGGLGVTPLMSIIRYCNDEKLANKINFIYSVRTPGDIVYKHELEKIKSENQHFDYNVTVTRPAPDHNWKGRTGRVDEGLLKQSIEDTGEILFYICGPLQFVKDVKVMLERLGAKKEQIKTDIWG